MKKQNLLNNNQIYVPNDLIETPKNNSINGIYKPFSKEEKDKIIGCKTITENIPWELIFKSNWIYTKGKEYFSDPKVPFNANYGSTDEVILIMEKNTIKEYASCADTSTWADHKQAKNCADKYNGYIGFELCKPYVGIDIDDCIDENGNINEIGLKTIRLFKSYTEYSMSGRGVKIIIKGIKKRNISKNNNLKVEIYDKGRQFVLTGNRYNDCDYIRECQKELDLYMDEIFGIEEILISSNNNYNLKNINDDPECIKILLNQNTIIPEGFRHDARFILSIYLYKKGIFLNETINKLSHINSDNNLEKDVTTIYKELDSNQNRYSVGCKDDSKLRQFLNEKLTYCNIDTCPFLKIEENDKIKDFNKTHAKLNYNGKTFYISEQPNGEINFSTKIDFFNFHENNLIKYYNTKKQCISNYNFINKWFKSEEIRTYNSIVFEPGKEVQNNIYNLWKGFNITKEATSCKLYLKHIKEIICNGNDEYYNYIISWMAQMIQDPCNKPGVAIVLRGDKGVGKSVFAEYFGDIYGQHFELVTGSDQFLGNFNCHLSKCILLFCDEAFWAGDKKAEGKLKGFITSPTFQMESKGKDKFHVKNCMHIITASNELWSAPVSDSERRFFILNVSDIKKGDSEYWNKLFYEKQNGGPEALLKYLLNFDYSNINLRKPPTTEELLNQKEITLETDCVGLYIQTILERGFQIESTTENKDYLWKNEILVQDVYNECIKISKIRGNQYKDSILSFGRKFRKMLSCVGKTTNTPCKYKFPSIEKCKKFYRDYLINNK